MGHYRKDGYWIAESDHDSEVKAAKRVNYLNGGLSQGSNEQLALGIMAAILMKQSDSVLTSVNFARKIMDTIYKTEDE